MAEINYTPFRQLITLRSYCRKPAMLSCEFKSALRSRPEEEETPPLSFREYCDFNGKKTNSWPESDMAYAMLCYFPKAMTNRQSHSSSMESEL